MQEQPTVGVDPSWQAFPCCDCAHSRDASRENDLVVGYCLGYAAKTHGVVVHAACLMSTHSHEVVTDVRGELPRFLQTFHRLLALATKAFRKCLPRRHLVDARLARCPLWTGALSATHDATPPQALSVPLGRGAARCVLPRPPRSPPNVGPASVSPDVYLRISLRYVPGVTPSFWRKTSVMWLCEAKPQA